MSPALISLVSQLIGLAIQYVPDLISEGEMVISLVTSGQDPTPDQQAQIDAALDKVNAALQAAIANKTD